MEQMKLHFLCYFSPLLPASLFYAQLQVCGLVLATAP